MLRAEGIRLVESRPKSLRVLAIQPLERDRIVEVGRDVPTLAQASKLRSAQPGLKRRHRRGEPVTPARGAQSTILVLRLVFRTGEQASADGPAVCERHGECIGSGSCVPVPAR